MPEHHFMASPKAWVGRRVQSRRRSPPLRFDFPNTQGNEIPLRSSWRMRRVEAGRRRTGVPGKRLYTRSYFREEIQEAATRRGGGESLWQLRLGM